MSRIDWRWARKSSERDSISSRRERSPERSSSSFRSCSPNDVASLVEHFVDRFDGANRVFDPLGQFGEALDFRLRAVGFRAADGTGVAFGKMLREPMKWPQATRLDGQSLAVAVRRCPELLDFCEFTSPVGNGCRQRLLFLPKRGDFLRHPLCGSALHAREGLLIQRGRNRSEVPHKRLDIPIGRGVWHVREQPVLSRLREECPEILQPDVASDTALIELVALGFQVSFERAQFPAQFQGLRGRWRQGHKGKNTSASPGARTCRP